MASKKKNKKGKRKVVGQVGEDEFLVEKILDKKQEDGVWKYLIKWLGWPSETNTWEPKEHLNSKAMLADLAEFEKQWEIDNHASPKLAPTEESDNPAVKSDAEHVHGSHESDNDTDILQACPGKKEPKCIVGVADVDGHMIYLVEWKKDQETVTEEGQEDRNFIRATPFKLKYPQVVIDFYVKHIKFTDPPSDPATADQ